MGVVRAYWKETLVSGFMMLMESVVKLAAPLLLQRLLIAVREGNSRGIECTYNPPCFPWLNVYRACMHHDDE